MQKKKTHVHMYIWLQYKCILFTVHVGLLMWLIPFVVQNRIKINLSSNVYDALHVSC